MFRRLAPQHDIFVVILSVSEESPLRCFAFAQHDRIASSSFQASE